MHRGPVDELRLVLVGQSILLLVTLQVETHFEFFGRSVSRRIEAVFVTRELDTVAHIRAAVLVEEFGCELAALERVGTIEV